MTTYTFAEIAQFTRTVEPSQKLGEINYCGMIAELAEALDRFEHNVAALLAHTELRHNPLDTATRNAIKETLGVLRSEVPKEERP